MSDNAFENQLSVSETIAYLSQNGLLPQGQDALRFQMNKGLKPGPDTVRIVCSHHPLKCPDGRTGRVVTCTVYNPDGTVEVMEPEQYCPS